MARVERVDDRLGLAVCRASLSGRSLVTYARDHVAVRTPSRPDFTDGNALDLLAPPAVGDLDRWLDRFDDTVGRMGAHTVHLRWEQPFTGGVGAVTDDGGDPAVAGALDQRGFALHPVRVLLLDGGAGADGEPPASLTADASSDVRIFPVAPPSAVPGGAVDRHWYASTVLYRYAHGEEPDDWRDLDDDFVTWSVDVQRELALAGRAQVWVAMRHGAPVARLTLAHDRQGLAVVEDVVVHPVHRGRGIATALTVTAVAAQLAVHPGSRVGVGAAPGSIADRLYRRLGFAPHATVWSARRP